MTDRIRLHSPFSLPCIHLLCFSSSRPALGFFAFLTSLSTSPSSSSSPGPFFLLPFLCFSPNHSSFPLLPLQLSRNGLLEANCSHRRLILCCVQPSASAPASPPPNATSYQDNARVHDWAPLALLAESSTQLPKGHLKTLMSNEPDEPSCAIDRENDFNVRIRIPPRGMPICVDDRATNATSPSYTPPSSKG